MTRYESKINKNTRKNTLLPVFGCMQYPESWLKCTTTAHWQLTSTGQVEKLKFGFSVQKGLLIPIQKLFVLIIFFPIKQYKIIQPWWLSGIMNSKFK